MRADILKQLIQAHLDGNEAGFRRAVIQLASAESQAGHTRIAEELRRALNTAVPKNKREGQVVDIAQPRGPTAGLLEGGHRDERFSDIVLPVATRKLLEALVKENRARRMLERFQVEPRRKLLFQGPPGCGKTLAAAVLAGEMGLPLMTVRFDALFSRFLGATASHLKVIFDEMPRRPAVYLFDEFDAVAQRRGDSQDVGEMRRIVTSFLQLLDADRSASLLIAATNHPELLDKAVFRRLDVQVSFELPDSRQLAELIELRLHSFKLPKQLVESVARSAQNASFADAARACDNAIRSMVLDGRESLTPDDVKTAFASLSSQQAIPRGG